MRNKNDNVNVYNLYRKDVRKYEMIDESKMKEFWRMYKNGNDEEKEKAKENIVGSYQLLVRSLAYKYGKVNCIMDAISEGNIGLLSAIDNYDPDKKIGFGTYAKKCIQRHILAYMLDTEPIVRPKDARKVVPYIPKARDEFERMYQREPTSEELRELIQKKYKITVPKDGSVIMRGIVNIEKDYKHNYSNYNGTGDDTTENSEYSEKTAECNTDDLIDANDKRAVVDEALSYLSERERMIVKGLYGIDQFPKTLNGMAMEAGLCRERTRQIAAASIKKMQKCVGDLSEEY